MERQVPFKRKNETLDYGADEILRLPWNESISVHTIMRIRVGLILRNNESKKILIKSRYNFIDDPISQGLSPMGSIKTFDAHTTETDPPLTALTHEQIVGIRRVGLGEVEHVSEHPRVAIGRRDAVERILHWVWIA